MTWDQIELFAEKATERHGTSMLMQARMHAIGTATGFSGDTKALDALARQVEGKAGLAVSPSDEKASSKMASQLMKLSESAGVRIKDHGVKRRRAVGGTRSPHKRVRRETPAV